MMQNTWLLFGFLCLTAFYTRAQTSEVWTLSRSVEYALENNIDIRKNVLNERLAKLQLHQSQLSQIPSASLSASYGKNLGRSIDPTSNQFINTNYDFVGLSGSSDVLLFGWFQKRNTIQANKYTLAAAQADYEQLQDDISLNVATAFLRILLAKENIAIAENQINFSVHQMEQTAAFVNVGRSPELELAQMESQVATDSANYYSALNNYQQSVLEMKALLNLNISSPYEPNSPNINNINAEELLRYQPEDIYEIAKNNFSGMKSFDLKIKASEKNVAARKGSLYPQLGMGYQVGTNYSSSLKDYSDIQITGSEPTGQYVNITGQNYPVYQPTFDFNSKTTPFFRQANNNLRHTFVLSLNIPLFNSWTARTSLKQAQIELENTHLDQERANSKLKQDIYTAYNEAKTALQKYYAAQKAASAASRALNFAQKRYELGLMNAVELLTTQNNNFKAQSEAASGKYDLFFKLKVIDYYLGKKLSL